ncbi:MAG: bacterial Ig-like domain-containing protein, partial [Synergistaceae bacterium]|nr:bacterial Ig-like domain-containing protein [Synergistaceae bacterium]
TKLSYIKGETLDLTGLDVVCRYTDETSANVTSQISLNVTNGAVVDSETPKEVIITYTESFDVVTDSFLLYILIIDSLEITPPTKTSYDNGDALDFTGLKVICKYTDGTTADVTSSVSLSVEEGAVVDEDTSNEITITYTEGTETVTGQFEIEII